MLLRYLLKNDLRGFNFNTNLSAIDIWANTPYDHTDLPRMREGRLHGQVRHSATGWSIFGTKKLILIFEFSSNFDDFLHPKSPIL